MWKLKVIEAQPRLGSASLTDGLDAGGLSQHEWFCDSASGSSHIFLKNFVQYSQCSNSTWGGMDIWVNEGSKTIYKVSGTSSAGRVESNAQCLQTNSSPNDNHQPVHTGNVRDQTFTLDVIEKHSLLCKCLYKYIFIYLSPFQAIKAHKKNNQYLFNKRNCDPEVWGERLPSKGCFGTSLKASI